MPDGLPVLNFYEGHQSVDEHLMTRKRSLSPRWGWHLERPNVDTEMLLPIPTVEKLSRDLSISNPQIFEKFYRDMHVAAHWYWFVDAEQDDPSRSQIRAAVERVVRESAKLASTLDQLDDKSKLWLTSEFVRLSPNAMASETDDEFDSIPREDGRFYNDLISELMAIQEAGKTLASKIKPTKSGRKTDHGLAALITSLADIYQEYTDTDPHLGFSYSAADREYDGPFFRFAEMCMRLIATDQRLTNNVLGEAIRRHLGWRS